MNRHVVIITATYNHCEELQNLYKSLVNQDNNSFRWVIVNDGSMDDTDNVVSTFINDGLIEINYIQKDNSGKSSSLNFAFRQIYEDELAVIVDDDEYLDSNAISIINAYYEKYYRTEVGIIHFHRRNMRTMSVIANYVVDEDLLLDYRSFKATGHNADGYVAYFGYALNEVRFPVYDGEKYIGPGVMMVLVGREYKMVWAKAVIGTTEYLENGITKQGRKLRVKNPIGGLYYCSISHCNFKTKLKYSLMGFAYKYISEKSRRELLELQVPIDSLNRLMIIPGTILGIYWKHKYLK